MAVLQGHDVTKPGVWSARSMAPVVWDVASLGRGTILAAAAAAYLQEDLRPPAAAFTAAAEESRVSESAGCVGTLMSEPKDREDFWGHHSLAICGAINFQNIVSVLR